MNLNSSDWLSSSGDNNACAKSDGRKDTGTSGCTHPCGYIITNLNRTENISVELANNSVVDLITAGQLGVMG